MGDAPILPSQLELLAVSLQYRGMDATGVAFQQDDGKVVIHKDNVAADRYVTGAGFKAFCAEHLNAGTRIALVHTRHATKGSPYKNPNNHPLFAGKSAIVHNGMIANDDHLFKELAFERSAETDSDIIRAITDRWGLTKKAIKQMNRLSGSVAAACIHPEFPNTVMFLRSGNPLVIGASNDFLVWASDRRAVFQGLRPWVNRYGFLMRMHVPDVSFVEMPNNSAIIHQDEKKIWHDEFDASHWGRGYNVGDIYEDRTLTVEKKPDPPLKPAETPVQTSGSKDVHFKSPEYVRCERCNTVLHVPEKDRIFPVNRMQCGHKLNNGAYCEGPLQDAALQTLHAN